MPAPTCPQGFGQSPTRVAALTDASALAPGLPVASPACGLQALPLPRTMLLVEDSRLAAEAVRLLCRRLGVRLRRADSLELAQAHLRVYRPDVVLVDPGLPDGSGLSLIAALCHARRRPARVIGFSGDPGMKEACLQAGADMFIAKPLQPARHLQDLLGISIADADSPGRIKGGFSAGAAPRSAGQPAACATNPAAPPPRRSAAANATMAQGRTPQGRVPQLAIPAPGMGTSGGTSDGTGTGTGAWAGAAPESPCEPGMLPRNHGADPLALQDDLKRARALISGAQARGRIDYTARFLRGIARCADDGGLMQAAEAALVSRNPAPLIAALDHRLRRNLDCI